MKNQYLAKIFFVLIFSLGFTINAQKKDKKEADSIKKATKELPLEPERKISFTTENGTWISVDVHPDGKTIMFDMMGDLYSIPILLHQFYKGMHLQLHHCTYCC